MSYLKSAALSKQQMEREREAEKTRYGKPYSYSIQSKPKPSTNTNKFPYRNMNTLPQSKTNSLESSTQLNSIGMDMFTVSSPQSQKRTGKPKPSTQNYSNLQNKRPQTTTGIGEKHYNNNNIVVRKPGTANGKMTNANVNNSSNNGPYSNEVGGFGKGDTMNRSVNRNLVSNNSSDSRANPKISLVHDTKVAKNLKSYPTFSIQERQRHPQQNGKRTEKMTTTVMPRCGKNVVVKEVKCQEQSNKNQVSFQSQRCINVDIISGDTDTNSEKLECPPQGKTSDNTINRIKEIGDGENLQEEDTVKIEKSTVEEDKGVAITELYSRRSSSSKSAREKIQVQNQDQMSPPTSAVSSSSEITIALQPIPLKTAGKNKKPQVTTQQQPIVSIRRENTGTKFEYRARMEEILAQPVRDLVSFSKGVLLLRHHDKLEGSLRLTNVSSEPICFRITSSIANRYKIEPKIGSMDADESIAIRIRTKQVFKENTIKRDRFTIESAITSEFPLTNEQVVQFWKKIPQGKVQKAQTNVTFIFDSADPKFRAILGGGTGINQTSTYIHKGSPLKHQVQTPTPSPSEIDNNNNIKVKKSSSSQLTTASSSRKISSIFIQKAKKNTSNFDNLELSSFNTKQIEKDDTRIIAVDNNNQRGPVSTFFLFCPIVAGFMFFVYQAITKHNSKLLGSSSPT